MVIHSHVDRDRREIRLVRLRQPRTTSDLLALELRKVSLDEEGTSYSALLYVWGSSIETEQIEINGQPFCVTQNLYDALEQLEMNSVSSWLWIDAICIRQSDLVEKTHQVRMMRDIFSNAATVYMWLGLGTEETDEAMDLVSRYGPRLYASGALELHFNIETVVRLYQFVVGRLDPSNSIGVGESPATELAATTLDLYTEYHENLEILAPGVFDILHQSYWCRIWIIQEVALAREAVVMVGDRVVSLDAFDAVFTAMWRGGSGALLRLSGNLYRIKALETGAAPGRPHYAATDPRDLLIGLLGVLDEDEKHGLESDYTQSFGEVFTRATRVMLESYGGPYFGLDCVKPGDFEGELPTWVPDFREIGRYGVRPHPINHGGEFFSAARDKSQPKRDVSVGFQGGNTLHRRGCIVDEVTEVFQPLVQAPEMANIETTKLWEDSVVDFVGLGPDSGPGEDYVWRTAVHGYTDHFQFCWKMYIDGRVHDVPEILRKVMRKEPLGMEGLSMEGLKFLRGDGIRDGEALTSVEPVKAGQTEPLANRLRQRVYFDMRRDSRTLFKTRKGMFGLGHIGIAPGDVVTLVWGVGSPIVLRPRDEGGYYFRGDSYVDGIMQGEFLETQPREQELIIH